MVATLPGGFFTGPASVIIYGSDRPMLNWVAYALASATDSEFLWVDVRTQGEILAESDLLARNVIPPSRLLPRRAVSLAPDNTKANVAVSAVVRADETPASLQLLLDFLRLPEATQIAISEMATGVRPRVAVLSNAHRLAAFYQVETVGPLLRAVTATGVIAIITSADAPNDARFSFDVVLYLDGRDPNHWRDATLRVEKGLSAGPLRTGSEYRLVELPAVAKVFGEHLH
jgi:hypothetical protein